MPQSSRPNAENFGSRNLEESPESEPPARSPLRLILKGSLWFGMAVAANRCLPAALIVILAAYLTPRELGVLAFILAYYAMLLPIADWSISYALQKLVPAQRLVAKQIYWTALLMRLGISVLLALFCWILDLAGGAFHGYGGYLGLLLVSSSFGTIAYAHNALGNFRKSSFYSLALYLMWMAISVWMVMSGMSIRGPLFGLIASFVLIGAWSSLFDSDLRGKIAFLPAVAREIVQFGFWATFAALFSNFAGQVGILVVAYVNGDTCAGVFKIAATLGVTSALFGMIVIFPLMPVAREGMLNGTDVAADLVLPIIRYLLMAALPITTVGFALAPEVIATFTNRAYASAVWPLRILLCANLVRALVITSSGVLLISDGVRALTKIYGVGFGVTLALGMVLDVRWPLIGVALASLFSWILAALLTCMWFWRNSRIRWEWTTYLKQAFSAVVAATVVYFSARFEGTAIAKLLLGAAIAGCVYLLFLWLQRDTALLRTARMLRNWAAS